MSGKVLNWSISGQENTIDHYTVFISTDGVNLMPLADVPANGRSLDLSGYGFASSTYTLYVKAVGKPSMTNKMSGPISWAQANSLPQAQLSVTTNSGIAPVAVTASTEGSTDSDGTISSSTINFGDGTVIKAGVASHSYLTPGNYTVTATVTDNMGASSTATQSVSVLTNQAPVAKVAVTPSNGTAPVTVTVDASGSYDPDGSVASGTVSFGDGTIVSGLKASHTYSAAGSFLVIVTVTDDRGASSTATSTVTVSAHLAPKISLAVTPTSGIAPATVTAVAQASSSYGTPAVVINWGDGTTPISATSGTHTYSQAGSYTVTATATDSFGYKSTATAVVSVARGSVQIASPTGNSITNTQTRVVATVSASAPISCMRIYLDSVSVYEVRNTSNVDKYIKVSKGSHSLVVQAWDVNGVVYKSGVNFRSR
jgi:PKD repeat protein